MSGACLRQVGDIHDAVGAAVAPQVRAAILLREVFDPDFDELVTCSAKVWPLPRHNSVARQATAAHDPTIH